MDSIIATSAPVASGARIRTAVALCGLAAGCWFVMFSPWTAGLVNFWASLSLASGGLAISALIIQRRQLRELFAFKPVYIVSGLLSAALLYAVFYSGNIAATTILPDAGSQIAGIYSTREEAPPWVIGLLLLLLIGPAEELFWRNYVQRVLGERLSPVWAFLIAAGVYTLVHIWSFNLLLLGAAAVCGLFWGAMYWRYRSVWPGLVSHALWDLAAFVLFPFS